MITKISGQLVEKTDHSLIINVNDVYYDVIVSFPVLQRIDNNVDEKGHVQLVIYHYIQLTPSNGLPVLIGFLSEVERDFFQQFIKVSGIGPRAAVKALNKPISEISRAIAEGDCKFLKTLPGIGLQRAKEIVAKLQGKVGKYGLIQDQEKKKSSSEQEEIADWQEEALSVLLQLQYKKHEAKEMIQKALDRSKTINTAEELLNEIYKQRITQ